MVMLVTEPSIERQLIAERQAAGIDQHDEVWEGVYVVSPIANNEHQDLILGLGFIFRLLVDQAGLGRSFPGVNVSDQKSDWKSNYRVPDVAVFLKGNPAQDRDTHWLGGPDLAVEIVSPGDHTRKKLEFYAQAGVREVLIVDRDPWLLELFRANGGKLISVGCSTIAQPTVLASQVLPVTFRLLSASGRPQIQVTHVDGRQPWLV